MRKKRRLVLKIVFALIIAFTVIVILSCLYFVVHSKRAQQRLVHLLCETDYHVLLESCRKMSKRVATGDMRPGAYWVRIDKDPKASQFQFPQVILDIEPVFVHIDSEGWVMLEMGGIPTYGVVVYPEDFMTGFDANIQLIPGLWYYDEDYDERYPKHQKEVDALIQKGKMRQTEKNRDGVNNRDSNKLGTVTYLCLTRVGF